VTTALRRLALVVALAACRTPAPSPDAGADASDPALAVAIDGPEYAFAGVPSCWRALHTGGAATRVSVTWGDGVSEDLAPGAIEACHAYRFPGPLIMAMAVANAGMRAEATRLVRVVLEPDALRPVQSSTIAYDAARDRVWVVEPDADAVTAIDAVARTRLRTIGIGDRPRTVAVAGDAIFVACQGDGTIHEIDAETLAPRTPIALGAGSQPYGVVADPRGEVAWVTLMGSGELARIDAARTVERIAIGPDPRAIAAIADGTIVVTRWRSTQIAAAVVVIDARDRAAPVVVGDTLLPRQEGLDSDTDNSGVLSFLGTAAPSPDGGRVIVPALKANVVSGTFRGSLPLTSQTTARAALAEVSLDGPGTAGVDTYRRSFDDLDYASAAVFSPMGDRLFVAMQGAEVVIAVDAFSFDSAGSIDDVGHAPQGLALDPRGRFLFVHATLSRFVRVYDVSDLSIEPSVLAEIATALTEPLPPDVLRGVRIFYGSRDARMSRTRYLSCASCHLDGESDDLVWDFTQRGEGLRNTISLRGNAGASPLHWSANFDEVQDFEHDIRGGQGGTGFLPDAVFHMGTRDTTLGDPKAGLDADLDALAAYVESLDRVGTSPFRRDGDAAWEAGRARGESIFRDPTVGCATCHSGARFTDSAFVSPGVPRLHDVGTLGAGSGQRLGAPLTGLDTPSLRGLWSSGPYLHDGSAATLRDVLVARNAADRHGTTSTLSEAELTDLETFLLSLDDQMP
jgi:DNA-binding beta-propeller fold protein YncE/cytochrome c peroxidase